MPWLWVFIFFLALAGYSTEAAASSELNYVKSIDVVEDGDAVLIEVSGPIKYTVFKLTDPSRVIVDIPGVEIGGNDGTVSVDNEYLSNIVASSYLVADKRIGRIEIGLKEGVLHKVKGGDKSILVALKKGGQAAPSAKPVSLKNISSSVRGKSTIVRIEADGPINNYNTFGFDDRASIVVDIWGLGDSLGKKTVPIKGSIVSTAKVEKHSGKVRIVFDAAGGEMPDYSVDKSSNGLILTLTKSASGSAKRAVTDRPLSVKSVDFLKLKNKARVKVASSAKPRYSIKRSLDGKILTVDILNATIAERLVRTIDATSLGTPVASVSSYQNSTSPESEVRILLRLNERSDYEIVEEGGTVYLDFPIKEEASAAATVAKAPIITKDVMPIKVPGESPPALASVVERQYEDEAPMAMAAPVTADDSVKSSELDPIEKAMKLQLRAYTGERITLDLSDAPVADVLKMLADQNDLNLIISDDVTGTVTMRLKNVRWDHAFEEILLSKGLGMVRIDNIIRVKPMEVLRRERETAIAAIKAKEKVEPLRVKYIQVNYEEAVNLEKHVQEVLSDRGTVTSHEATNTLIVKDTADGIEASLEVVKNLDRAVPQVLIEARIVEASSNFARDLGIQWGVDYSGNFRQTHTNLFGSSEQKGQTAFDPGTQFAPASGDVNSTEKTNWPSRSGVTNYAVNLPAASKLGALGFIFGNLGASPLILDLRISAGETAGLLKTISRPRITTLDNKEAKIEQGESIPFETTSSTGTTTTFVDANLSLTVTPQITPDGSILMQIKASRNSVGTFRTSSGEPSINKKEAQTEVLVKNGETTVIGGIVVTDTRNNDAGIPFLKEIPFFGWFFKSKSVADSQTELLIFITPTIIDNNLDTV